MPSTYESQNTRISESGLFQRALAGDRAAEEQLIEQIRLFARRIAGRGPAAGADWEDLAQEAARRLFAVGLHQYGGAGSERSYLYSLVKSTWIEVLRGERRRAAREEVSARAVEVRQAGVHGSDPSGIRALVHLLVRKIDPGQRRLIERVFLEGRTYRELAEEAGVVESSIRSRVCRSLQQLRSLAAAA